MSKSDDDGTRLFGRSRSIQTLMLKVSRVATTRASVLIVGESGAGKDIVARLLHDMSPRRRGPFVPVNCGAIPGDIAESQLFGHEKGSFTGAVAQHVGMFEAARGGTLFLDEIAEMPLELQVKLLRTLESNTIMRVGGHEAIPIDVRIVAATHHDPVEAVRSGRLREDLFYRIATVALHVPALRQREDDVGEIAMQIVERLNTRHRTRKRLSTQAMKALRAYTWPGNVRELRNAVERAFILADEQIDLQLPRRQPPREEVRHNAMTLHIGTTLAHTQQRFIVASLRHFNGDKPRTAKALGISLKTLYNRLALLPEHERNLVANLSGGTGNAGGGAGSGTNPTTNASSQ
ncbi:sigma-54 dependent transcriptional regulator [Burkholderia multivorans]|jgi:DNA-binding NtrC family response regulator|uniref:Sigma-54-dependent Fis family transcriptional regulator n=1 Tax=Burkholderia multivorans TaxID=87883 RepID=A0AB37B1V1_9BURK|nr:sigma-54 dependent transcriptional regulator [Burkholderia multivorans]KWA39785.1 Fis family transcriptional regulator [Burkholderia multivorans]MBN6733115.1 sigma-54-dependent Fis family transcriptional regulator [Burkholderia multivorans]MBN6738657.1 sigma-54-dependent Fis family transcriptional regulator [Burkholderia multivorans]MBN7128555.1 sigma-54-dependent Fis family transcriptional regulator [Burkholderia multivorans]MBN8167419.1 sigma-54-dependent Fis family transcriptional regula